MVYLPRSIDRALDFLAPHAPAIALDGPRGVGKTETASRRAEHVWNMEIPSQRAQLDSDLDFEALSQGTLFIDEWQNHQDSWNAVRRAVDNGAAAGRFLLAGSATPKPGMGTHSGAGRILSLRMRPMGLHERDLHQTPVSMTQLLTGSCGKLREHSDFSIANYYTAICASGLPEVFNKPARIRQQYLDSYLQRIVDRDLPEQGRATRKPATFRRWLRAYAAASSTTTTQKTIIETAGEDGDPPRKTTAISYRDYLSRIWILDPVDGWSPSPNPFTSIRETQSGQKHQLADPALAAHLLGVTPRKLATPSYSDLAGKLFESLAVLTVRAIAEAAGARVGHLRTDDGRREIDLIIEGPEGEILAIEVKLSPNFRDEEVRHLRWFREQIPEAVTDTIVITTGDTAYRRRDGIAVVPLALLGD